jgi:hypothetical protein
LFADLSIDSELLERAVGKPKKGRSKASSWVPSWAEVTAVALVTLGLLFIQLWDGRNDLAFGIAFLLLINGYVILRYCWKSNTNRPE